MKTINKPADAIDSITWNELHSAHFSTLVPFSLQLDDNNGLLYCEKVIRIIPRKRIVAFGIWHNKPVVAKLFFAPTKAEYHFKKEVAGIKALVNACIPTPTLLWQGNASDTKIYVLIFERLVSAINLDILWQRKTDAQSLLPLLRSVIIELATQHVLGVVQRDLHMKNFLITENKIYSLDGSSIIQFAGVLSKEQSLNHLALFFAQLDMGTEKLQQELFNTYTKARGWLIKKSDIKFLHSARSQWLKKRWLRLKNKLQRTSTLFIRKKTMRSVMMYERAYQSPDLLDWFKNPEAIYQYKETQVLKAGNSATVVKAKINNTWVVIKRYQMKNIWHKLKRCCRDSRAVAAWQLSQRLRLFGIRTAKPIAFMENRFLGLRGSSYLIMEYIDGSHLGEYVSIHQQDQDKLITISQRVINLLINLKKMHLMHGDLKMTNILIQNHQPVLIDLDGMKEYHTRLGENLAFRKEIQRLMKNWQSQPEIYALFQQQLQQTVKK